MKEFDLNKIEVYKENMIESIHHTNYIHVYAIADRIYRKSNTEYKYITRKYTRELFDIIGEFLEESCIKIDNPDCYNCHIRQITGLCMGVYSDSDLCIPINYLRYIYNIYLNSEDTISTFTSEVYKRIQHASYKISSQIKILTSAS